MSMTPSEEARLLMNGGGLLTVGGATGTAPYAQTFDRRLCSDITFQPASGTITMTGIWLPQGATVTGITFVSAATGETGGTHLWYALYKGNVCFGASSYTLMAQSTDDVGATTFATNTALRKALTTPQVCPYSGLYLLGFMCANSAGSQPALYNLKAAGVNATGNITGMTPIVASTADTGLTTTAQATLGSQTAIVQALYAFVD